MVANTPAHHATQPIVRPVVDRRLRTLTVATQLFIFEFIPLILNIKWAHAITERSFSLLF